MTSPSTAGIVLWRRPDPGEHAGLIEILIVHPGGPFWSGKDAHAWSIPKGEFDPEIETPEAAAIREFDEEIGVPVPSGERIALPQFRAGKKTLYAFAVEGSLDADLVQPEDQHRSMVDIVWPPRSGRIQRFPEVDRAAWVDLDAAEAKLHKGQSPLVERVRRAIPLDR